MAQLPPSNVKKATQQHSHLRAGEAGMGHAHHGRSAHQRRRRHGLLLAPHHLQPRPGREQLRLDSKGRRRWLRLDEGSDGGSLLRLLHHGHRCGLLRLHLGRRRVVQHGRQHGLAGRRATQLPALRC